MSIIQAIVLGIVQGVTEFLPISSSGHLILIPYIFGWQIQDLSFDVALHLGSSIAIGIYFFNDYLKMIRSIFTNRSNSDSKILISILIVLLPVVVLAYFLSDIVENVFRNPLLVAAQMLIISFVMFLADKTSTKDSINNIYAIPFGKKLFISLSQVIALIPGTSRSGITISTAMLLKVDKEVAAKFSFLLSAPIIIAASIQQLLLSESLDKFDVYIVIGVVTSFVASLLSIKFLLVFLKSHDLSVFIIYRVLLAGLLLFFVFT